MKYLLVGLFLMTTGIMLSQTKYINYADSVDQYVQDLNWMGAERVIQRALKEEPANPNNFLLLSNLGTIHRRLGRLKEALNDYNNALTIAPNAVTILHNRAALYLEMDSLRLASIDYERIMSLDPLDIDSRYYHGMIALEYGEMKIARENFEEAMKLDKTSLNAKRGMAIWHKISRNYDKAVELYSEIIEQENRIANYLSRAECYLELNKTKEAGDDLMEAQKLDPTNGTVYLLKAQLAELLFRYDDAADYAEQAIEFGIDPDLVKKYTSKNEKK